MPKFKQIIYSYIENIDRNILVEFKDDGNNIRAVGLRKFGWDVAEVGENEWDQIEALAV